MSVWNYFKKKPIEARPAADFNEPDSILSVRFFINEEGRLDVMIDSVDDDPRMAKLLGHMFHLITAGLSNNLIVDYFQDLVTQDPAQEVFIQQVIAEWSAHITKAEKEKDAIANKPVVGPMEFISNVKRMMGDT
jgi:hypothetical protein